MSALVARDIEVRRGKALAVSGMDLTIESNQWFGLIGANGSGKTSFLRALAGRLPIEGGSITVHGKDLSNDRQARAASFGFAPPPDSLPNALRADELIRLAGPSSNQSDPRWRSVFEALGIDELRDRFIGNCSAGMKQRLALACAFASGHDIVILDEPLNWLDPVAAFDLNQALRAMVDDGLILITALHDLSVLARNCDAGLMMSAGKATLHWDKTILSEAATNFEAFQKLTIESLRAGVRAS